MKTVCESNNCTGCLACVDVCSKSAIKIMDTLSEYNAVIDETKCVNCKKCFDICQVNNPLTLMPIMKSYQGWALDEEIRMNSSSGGAAMILAKTFVEKYGVVCSCIFERGEFVFSVAETVDELIKFAGSKYVKSNPIGIYKKIRELIISGIKVLFIGLPCQVGAVKRFLGTALERDLYTIDLICHGTPSPQILANYLEEKGLNVGKIQDIKFRKKTKFHLYVDNRSVVNENITDSYLMAFLNALCYTANCYNCIYAQNERVSDITLGDSWGSQLSESEQKKGISLLLCQTKKGVELIEQSDIYLQNVDLNLAIAGNQQLKHPSKKPKKQKLFWEEMKRTRSFCRTMSRCYPGEYCKNIVKSVMIKLHILPSKLVD